MFSKNRSILLKVVCLLGLMFLALSSVGFAQDKNGGSVSPVGSWYGNALPDNPGPRIPPEVVMMPTFFSDGNLIANDSQEANVLHTTAHGTWVRTGSRRVKATFLWFDLAAPGTVDNGLQGKEKVILTGEIDPHNPNEMTGTLEVFIFGPDQNPLTDDGLGPITFTIQKLQRIQ